MSGFPSGILPPMMKFPQFFQGQMGVPGSDTPLGLRLAPTSHVYFVDKNHPDATDSNDGTDPMKPKLTIGSAQAAAHANIDWAHDSYAYNWIFVNPGTYEENLGGFYYTHLIGLGLLGTDTAAEIHPVAGSAVAGTLLGAHFQNIRFECETAVPVIDVGIGNNSIIEGCEIVKGIADLATIGIEFDNATHVQILDNLFVSGVTNLAQGIVFNGGANQYAHACRIMRNTIWAATKGIAIAAACTATNCLIQGNVIARPTTGIEDLNTNSYVVDNWISALVDAISHALSTTHCIANHVLDNAVGAVEAVGTD